MTRIGACIMVHNMAPLIGACINSLNWTDGIFLYDDHSTDTTIETAKKHSKVPIVIERSSDQEVAFEKGELEVRNYILSRAFERLDIDVLIILDADELLSSLVKPRILESFSNPDVDSVAFTTWHLYSERKYIHFWEAEINGVKMVDPHTRVIRKGKKYTPLFKDGSHPIIQATEKTKCFHGPYHFHLKYYNLSTLPNYSLFFLPKFITRSDVAPYLRDIPFKLPSDISHSISLIDWKKMPKYKSTPHYKLKRVKFIEPKEALVHPKDKDE